LEIARIRVVWSRRATHADSARSVTMLNFVTVFIRARSLKKWIHYARIPRCPRILEWNTRTHALVCGEAKSSEFYIYHRNRYRSYYRVLRVNRNIPWRTYTSTRLRQFFQNIGRRRERRFPMYRIYENCVSARGSLIRVSRSLNVCKPTLRRQLQRFGYPAIFAGTLNIISNTRTVTLEQTLLFRIVDALSFSNIVYGTLLK